MRHDPRSLAQRCGRLEAGDGFVVATEQRQQVPAHGVGGIEHKAANRQEQQLAVVGLQDRLEHGRRPRVAQPGCGPARQRQRGETELVPWQRLEVIGSEPVEAGIALPRPARSRDPGELDERASLRSGFKSGGEAVQRR